MTPPNLETVKTEFGIGVNGFLFAVNAGVECSDALNVASASLASADSLLRDLVDVGEGVHLAFAVRALVREAKALIDSSVVAVERAEDQR
ncbi:hypothetical protein [Pseudomonas mosselii]|uniref:hypothetical protein n=1 Tax=Pseudomonas mosselii TaxID=78327 RepID=UPI001F1A076F|nr:hypothetical protein [Pseudomonas mosselii]